MPGVILKLYIQYISFWEKKAKAVDKITECFFYFLPSLFHVYKW